MCVIVFKNKGQEPVSKDTLKLCWKRNSDGAGYAFYNKNKKHWNCHKGFTSFKRFWKSYSACKFTTDSVVVAHFRIGTSGGKKTPECTHPFPIVDNCEDMTALKFQAKKIVFHNGVIGQGEGQFSDTMVSVRDHLDLLYDLVFMKDDKRADALLSDLLKTRSNRYLITYEDHIWTYGDWKEKDGIQYSNLNWEPTKPVKTHHRAGGAHGTTPNNWNNWRTQGTGTGNVDLSRDDIITCVVDKEGNCYLKEPTITDPNTFDICPNCYEDKYIDTSHFDVGNCTCLTCGCVFTSETGEIHLFDGQVVEYNSNNKTEVIEAEVINENTAG